MKKGQILPATRITQENIIESVQLLYDLFGNSINGIESRMEDGKEVNDTVWLAGVRLRAFKEEKK